MVQNFYVTLLYKLKTMTQQKVVVQLQGTAVSLVGSLETVVRLNFRVFSITINTITSRNLSAITTDQTAFTLQWLFRSIAKLLLINLNIVCQSALSYQPDDK